MASRQEIEALELDIKLGRALVERHRKHLAELIETGADPVRIAAVRGKLEICEEAHAEDLAELKRLTAQ